MLCSIFLCSSKGYFPSYLPHYSLAGTTSHYYSGPIGFAVSLQVRSCKERTHGVTHDEMGKIRIIGSNLLIQFPAVITDCVPTIFLGEPAFVFIAFLCLSMTSMVLNKHDKALFIQVSGELIISEAMLSHAMVQMECSLWILNPPYSIEQ